MAGNRRSRAGKLRRVVASRAKDELLTAARTTSEQLVKTRPNDAAIASKMLKDVAGRVRTSGKGAMKQFTIQGLFRAPALPYSAARPGAALGKGKALLASALSSAIRRDLGDVVQTVLKNKAAKYKDLVEALGDPDANEWAAMLRKAILWNPATGNQLAGQVRTLAGQLLERLRKATPAFKAAPKEAAAIVDVHNELARRRLVGSRVGKAREAAERQFRETEAFGRPEFFEDIVDGDGKLLHRRYIHVQERQNQFLYAKIGGTPAEELQFRTYPFFLAIPHHVVDDREDSASLGRFHEA